MFTKKDKVKERVISFVQNPETSCLVCKNNMYKPVGVSVVMTYTYNINDLEIFYDKWFVEDFEDAKRMNLPGCEHHDELIKGSGVTVLSKELGTFVFFGAQANEIINACELNRDLTQYMFHQQHGIQK